MRAVASVRTVLAILIFMNAVVTQAATFVYVSNADSKEISALVASNAAKET